MDVKSYPRNQMKTLFLKKLCQMPRVRLDNYKEGHCNLAILMSLLI